MKKGRSFVTGLIAHTRSWNLPLEHLVFLGGATVGIVLSAFGAVSNALIGLPLATVLIPFINLAIDVACLVYSIIVKRWRGAALIVFFFASFVLFPFLWFTTGGTMSSSLPLVIGLGVVQAIIFRGKTRWAFFISVLLLYSSFIVVELYHPGNFIPYPDREAWYFDVLVGFVLSFVASGGLAFFTFDSYNKAKRESEELMAQLHKSVITDPLTGVFNRRHLMARIDEEMRSAFDSGAPLSLCIIDLDHFKNINDTYGHVYGDEVLVQTTREVSGALGPQDILGRYGGEEFVAVFPGSDLEAARRKAEALCAAIRNSTWSRGNTVTASIGVSAYTKGVSYSKFLEQADVHLYTAKQNGRDRVEG